jgi:hypothetical protein
VRRWRSSGSAAAGEPCKEGFSETKLMSVPGVELVGEQLQGKALTIEPLRRQVTSPGGRSKLERPRGRSRRRERHDMATALRVGAAGKPRTEGYD